MFIEKNKKQKALIKKHTFFLCSFSYSYIRFNYISPLFVHIIVMLMENYCKSSFILKRKVSICFTEENMKIDMEKL